MKDVLVDDMSVEACRYSRRRLAARFGLAERASVAIEFALLIPIFVAIILEIFQFGMFFYISSIVDIATSKAARQTLIGSVGNQNLQSSQFISQFVCPQLGGLSCSSSIVVNLLNLPATPQANGFLSLVNSAGTDLIQPPMTNASTSFCPGFSGGKNPSTGQGGVEVLEIFYPMPVFSLYWLSISTTSHGAPVYFVRGIAAFQNEPYPVTGQAGGC